MIIDFHIRWNSTYVMLFRFFNYKQIINNLTSYPDNIEGIKEAQKRFFRQRHLKPEEWKILESLIEILEPIYHSTIILSARK